MANDVLLISEYDFKKHENSSCSPKGVPFETLDEAERECKETKQCIGVMDVDCGVQKEYHLCGKNTTVFSDSKVQSCFHEKYIVGKY